jgi:hypothetical protein
MRTVSGQLKLAVSVEDFRSSFSRPGSTATIDTFDDLDVLDKLPLARDMADELFDVNPTIIDSESGLHEQRVSWDHAYVSSPRKFTIQRARDPEEMDWWRDFLDNRRGRREPFLMPTYRLDLFLATIPSGGDPTIEIEGVAYANTYFDHDTYKRLRFVNPDGDVIYRKVSNATVQPGGTTYLDLETALPVDPSWSNGFEIGFLNKCRLASDTVRLSHFGMYTILELGVVTTDE